MWCAWARQNTLLCGNGPVHLWPAKVVGSTPVHGSAGMVAISCTNRATLCSGQTLSSKVVFQGSWGKEWVKGLVSVLLRINRLVACVARMIKCLGTCTTQCYHAWIGGYSATLCGESGVQVKAHGVRDSWQSDPIEVPAARAVCNMRLIFHDSMFSMH